MRSNKVAFVLGLVLALSASACGGGKDKSAAQITGAMSNMFRESNGTMIAAKLQEAKKIADNKAMLLRFEAEAKALEKARSFQVACSDFSSMTDSSCSAGSVTIEGADGNTDTDATCTATCSSSTASVSCTLNGEITQACAGTTYTFKNGTIGVTVPPATCSQSGDTITIAITMGLDFAVDVKGGDLTDYVSIDCNMSNSLSIAFSATSGAASSVSSSVTGTGTFSCTLDGQAIDQEALSEAMAENSC